MLRKLTFSLLLVIGTAFASQAAFAGHGIPYPGKHHAFRGAAKHHFVPPGHRKHGYRVTRHSYGYRHYAPPVRVVRHSRVIYRGHRHFNGCGHHAYRPSYYSGYHRYYSRPYYRDYRYAGWPRRDDGFGFFIFYDY